MSYFSRRPGSQGSRFVGPRAQQPSKVSTRCSPRQWDQLSEDKAWEEWESWSSTPGRLSRFSLQGRIPISTKADGYMPSRK
eukprot:12729433-Heterocapsa_arctica.AAC.1